MQEAQDVRRGAERKEGGKRMTEPKQRGGVNGGHRVMRGLNATNAMSQGLIKTSSALLPRSGHAHMHLCDGSGGFVGGWVSGGASEQHRV